MNIVESSDSSSLSIEDLSLRVLHAASCGQLDVLRDHLSPQTIHADDLDHAIKLTTVLNFVDAEGCTPLHLAATHRFPHIIKYLLSFPQTDVNALNHDHLSPLYCALQSLECVNTLLDHPLIDANTVDSSNKSVLTYAAEGGKLEILRVLCAFPGIQPNIADDNGFTALIAAASLGRADCVELLLQTPGIDVNQANSSGNNALFLATSLACYRLLINHPDININHVNNNETSALMYAVAGGRAYLELLLQHSIRPDFNIRDRYGRTALSQAITYDSYECLDMLLSQENIDVNVRNNQGLTPVLLASKRHSFPGSRLLLLLLKHPQVNINDRDDFDLGLLEHAMKTPNGHTLKILFHHPGIDISTVAPSTHRNALQFGLAQPVGQFHLSNLAIFMHHLLDL